MLLSFQNRDPASFAGYYQDPRTSPTAYHSPMSSHFPHHSPTAPTSHAHPSSHHDSISQSPRQSVADHPSHRRNSSYYADPNVSSGHPALEYSQSGGSRRESHQRPQEDTKASNPMSFSNILSSNAADPPIATPRELPPTKQFRKAPPVPNGDLGPASAMFKRSSHKPTPTTITHEQSEPRRPSKGDTYHPTPAKIPKPKARSTVTISDKENERIRKELAKIDAMDLSDIDTPEWELAKQDFVQASKKRLLEVGRGEENKRKVALENGRSNMNVG